ncbi:protein kinase domain-containing protein [Streptomyces griseoaurantiacus]|uniref:Serine/threonine protein kinase n=1 Tax=Streptomyces griseoaurantiacus TaxID=68213 RepID=A0A1G7Q1G2_9ACTN|nr:PQQ-binding-like beta-propeller repeat protein [Streptomyces jietaisiensis]SDF92334.1 Serine/threonine protein kinase [Streptomyces jietaisiensis]
MPSSTGESESVESLGGYELVERLGSGGMGVVHLGRSASGRLVAVKVVHAPYAEDEEFRARFRQEVAAVRRVSGAFTAPVVDADPEAAQPWMATLYVPGRTLAELVSEDGPLGGRALRNLATGLVEALRDIHRAGVVHRNLKPGNVLMAEDGPRVIDFGISRAADDRALTVTGRPIGAPSFMSPEQFASPREVTAASDVFSLGSLLVYAATGRGPFDADSPYPTGYQVMHEQPDLEGVAEPLRSLAERCLAKDPASRPTLAELHELFRSLPDTPEPPGAPGGAPSAAGPGGPRRRVRRLAVLGAALVIAVAGTAAYALSSRSGEGDRTPLASASHRPAVLPTGFQPWRTGLSRRVAHEPTSHDVDAVNAGCVSDGTALYCAGTGFTVARVDAASGRVGWWYGGNTEAAERPLGVRGGIVYTYEQPHGTAVHAPRRLLALDAATGKRVWSREIDASHPAALFNGGVLAVAHNSSDLVALDPKTGEQRWRTAGKSSVGTECGPLAPGGAPYALCTDAQHPAKGPAALLHLNPADGTARELTHLSQRAVPLGAVSAQPLFALRKHLDAGPEGGRDEEYEGLIRIDPISGALIRVRLPDTPRGTPTLLNGIVYFVRPDGTVTAYSANGPRLWQRDTEVEDLSGPARSAGPDALYLAGRHGRLVALDRETGDVRWTTDKLPGLGTPAGNTVPSVLTVKDALVAVVGDTAFSADPDHPTRAPSAR